MEKQIAVPVEHISSFVECARRELVCDRYMTAVGRDHTTHWLHTQHSGELGTHPAIVVLEVRSVPRKGKLPVPGVYVTEVRPPAADEFGYETAQEWPDALW